MISDRRNPNTLAWLERIFWNNILNDSFMIVFCLHLFTVFFLCRLVSKYNLGWSSFFFTGWVYTLEFGVLTFMTSRESAFYFGFSIFFSFSINTLLICYLFSLYYRFAIMAMYTFFKYTHYWFKSIINEHNYYLINHFFSKNSEDYWNLEFLQLFKNKSYLNYFIKQKNINKNFLNFLLNDWFLFYVNSISRFYYIIPMLLTLYHVQVIRLWFRYNCNTLITFFYVYEQRFLLAFAYFFIIKIHFNSICFDKFFSYNFLRYINFSKQLELSDDLMDWEPSYYEIIVIHWEDSPEETSIYDTDPHFGDYEEIFEIYKENIDLETLEVNYRFYKPWEWRNCKTYVIDSYDNTVFQNLNIFFGDFCEYMLLDFEWQDIFCNELLELNLELKI